jgi:tetratricopeptide (TPR) repeat protein
MIGIGGFFVYKKETANPFGTGGGEGGTATTTGNGNVGVGEVPGGTISILPDVPSLTALVSYKSSLSAEQKSTFTSQIATERNKLKEDSNLYQSWLILGSLYKNVGDYDKAIEVWNYAHALIPKEATPLNNIGNLYTYETHDYVKAEASYLAAEKVEPTFVYTYRYLYELYTAGVYKQNTTAAIDALLRGINKNPKAIDLLSLAGNYYKGKGDTVNAKKYFTFARDQAHAVGDANAEAAFNAELK